MIEAKMIEDKKLTRDNYTWQFHVKCQRCKKLISFFFATPGRCVNCGDFITIEYLDMVELNWYRASWHRGHLG